jgi:hypothetical protein
MLDPISTLDLIPELRVLMRDQVNDAVLSDLITRAAIKKHAGEGQPFNGVTLFQDAITRFKGQLSEARNSLLFPDQESPSRARLADCYLVEPGALEASSSSTVSTINSSWRSLMSDACHLTLAIANEYQNLPARAPERELRAIQIVDALRQLLLSRICAMRANINQNVWEEESALVQRFARPIDALEKLRVLHADYNRQVRKWALHLDMVRGEKEIADAIAYNSWRSDFGHPHDRELGWGPFARVTRLELRYLRYKMELVAWEKSLWNIGYPVTQGQVAALRASLHVSLRAIENTALSLTWPFRKMFLGWLSLVTRLSQRPGVFTTSIALTVLTFSVLYFIDDFILSNCGGRVSPFSYAHTLYYAVANFTSVGASGTCGPYSGLLISSESLFGYFLLSVLAAMIFTWFADR